MASDIIICFDVKTERLLKVGTTLTVCRYPSRRIVNQSLLWKRLLLLKKQNPNIRELPETQLNIHGAWYGKSGPDMVGRGPAGAWYGGCNMVWNVPTLVGSSCRFPHLLKQLVLAHWRLITRHFLPSSSVLKKLYILYRWEKAFAITAVTVFVWRREVSAIIFYPIARYPDLYSRSYLARTGTNWKRKRIQ